MGKRRPGGQTWISTVSLMATLGIIQDLRTDVASGTWRQAGGGRAANAELQEG
jgi:hypothetical protein